MIAAAMKYVALGLVLLAVSARAEPGEVIPNHPNCPEMQGPLPHYFIHPTNCSRFYECHMKDAWEYECPAGLHFNVAIDVCDFPVNAKSYPPTTSEPPSPPHPTDPHCPPPGATLPNYWAHGTDCSRYYGCLEGCVKEFKCPDGLYWNDQQKRCDSYSSSQCDCPNIPPAPNMWPSVTSQKPPAKAWPYPKP
uniref:Chitin-binding type-2 domain-containing protein n=1 Tax=Anopheles melas TaxID=34690 RepID=A0A182UJG4_9DIPT